MVQSGNHEGVTLGHHVSCKHDGSVSNTNACLLLGLQANVHVLCEDAVKNISAIFQPHRTNSSCSQH